MYIFQRLARIFRRVHEIVSSLHLSVTVQSVEISSESEIPTTVEMQPKACQSGVPDIPVLPEDPNASGIFGTALISCHIRVVGPMGREKVVDLRYHPFLPLWLYLVTRAEASVPIEDILREVYGSQELAEHTKTGQDQKARLKRKFRYQCRSLQNEVNAACVEVDHPETKIVLSEKRDGATCWYLSDAVQIEDLARFKACRFLLAGLEEIQSDEVAYRAEVKAACKRLIEDIGYLSDVFKVHEMPKPWFQQLLKEALYTYSDALQYLATQAHRDAEETSEEKARRSLRYRESYFWEKYALSCAGTASEFPEERETLISAGELALQKALSCSSLLRDRFNATDIYYEFQELAGEWEPNLETERIWQHLLAVDEEIHGSHIPPIVFRECMRW